MPTVHVHLLPSLIPHDALRGGVAVVVDLLRASSTIVRALDAGAARILPCLESEDARILYARMIDSGTPAEGVVLGGERGGVRIPGFDLDNSPARYTPQTVGGRTVVFTTTNGTRALFTARDGGASPILVGCLNNLAALVDRLSLIAGPPAPRAVHVICAGTNEQVSQEDVLCAGAIADALLERKFNYAADDQVRIAHGCWLAARDRAGGVLDALRHSRGGRNLTRLGLDADIESCARLDTSGLVPVFGPDGSIVQGTPA